MGVQILPNAYHGKDAYYNDESGKWKFDSGKGGLKEISDPKEINSLARSSAQVGTGHGAAGNPMERSVVAGRHSGGMVTTRGAAKPAPTSVGGSGEWDESKHPRDDHGKFS